MQFQWNGDAIVSRIKAAASAALSETDGKIVEEAQGRVRVASGNLRSHIKEIQSPSPDNLTSQVGVDDVPYAAIQELGPATARNYSFTPYLRPARDIHAKDLAALIKRKFGG